jgi:hypothetical protein
MLCRQGAVGGLLQEQGGAALATGNLRELLQQKTTCTLTHAGLLAHQDLQA